MWVVAGCDSTPLAVDPPDDPPDTTISPWDDTGLVAFLTFTGSKVKVGVAPFNAPENYRIVSFPDSGDSFSDPRLSPDKKYVTFFREDGNGPSYVVNLESDDVDLVIHEGGSYFSGASETIIWNSESTGFFFTPLEAFWARSGKMYFYDNSTDVALLTHEIGAPLGTSVGRDTLLIRGLGANAERLLFHLASGYLAPLENSRLRNYYASDSEGGTIRLLDWNEERRLFTGQMRTPSQATKRTVIITDLNGSVFEEVPTRGFDSRNPKWGPGSIILYTRLSLTESSIWARNIETDEIREWASGSVFGESQVAYPDY